MRTTKERPDLLQDRVVSAVEKSHDLDKALARVAGVLYPELFIQRVSVGMVLGDELVIVGLWTARPTRVVKGMKVRVTATSLPEVRGHRAVFSSEGVRSFAGDALKEEGINAWVSIPIPEPIDAVGVLRFSAGRDVFSGMRPFFENLGPAIGTRVVELALQSRAFRTEILFG